VLPIPVELLRFLERGHEAGGQGARAPVEQALDRTEQAQQAMEELRHTVER
jgi:hypothetical protein